MQGSSQEGRTELESRACRSKIVMLHLHYDESMENVQTGIA